MNNFSRYLTGFVIGMCVEYMIRVEVSLFPILIIIALLLQMVLDLFKNEDDDTKPFIPWK